MLMSFPYGNWRSLDINTRHKIAEQFGIKKTNPTHVANNEIVDDGYNYKDLEANLKVANLQAFLGTTETDYSVMWGWLVDLMEGRNPEIPIPANSVVEVVTAPEPAVFGSSSKVKKVVKPRVSKVKKDVKIKKANKNK